MKKLILIVAFFVSQVGFGQYYTFQSFANYEDIIVNNSGEYQLVEPFHSFISQNGYYDINGEAQLFFDDDPSEYIFQMFIEPEQANFLEDMLLDSSLILNYSKHEGYTEVLIDRMVIRFDEGFVPEFIGIFDGVIVTDYEPLNTLFYNFGINGYQQTFPTSQLPFLQSVYHIRCFDCNVFELLDNAIEIDIINLAEHWGFVYLSLNDPVSTKSFVLYPNPNNGIFQISHNSNEFLGAQLTIFDALGRKVHDEKLMQTNNTIHLNGITPGLYFAQLSYNEKTSVKKFVVK